MKYKKNIRGAINDATLRCIDAKMHRGKVDYGNKNCHTEDKSPKYRIVDNVCSSLRANAKQSSEIVITRSDKRRSNRIHIENNEIGATHVALCNSVGSYFRHWCGAFTLAEVLITLGIIGIVAAMTMPSLINNYQKKLAATRLKHFSSMMQQAAKMRDKDVMEGDFVEMQPTEVKAYNPDDIENFYKQYWLPYVKTVNMTKLTKGLLVEYANGSGAYFQKVYLAPDAKDVTNNSYIVFCPEYKYCKDIDVLDAKAAVDGRHTFSLWNGGTVPLEFTYMPYSREELVDKCKTQKYYCSSLIYFDGWQISKDYPW